MMPSRRILVIGYQIIAATIIETTMQIPLAKTIFGLSDKKALNRLFVIYLFLYAFGSIVSNIFVGFQQTHNDFWDTYFVARHMTWADEKTWFSPQYPIANCLFCKLITGTAPPEIPGILANLFFGTAILVVSMLLYRKILEGRVALYAIVALSLFPRLFHYVNLAGGDPASIAFFSLGVLLIAGQLFKSDEKSWGIFLLGGIFLGCGGIFRYHALVASIFFLVASAIVCRHDLKFIVPAFIGLWIGYCPQFVVNLITNHWLFETQFGMMNVYDLMYSMPWYHTLTVHFPPSILSLIMHDPMLFTRNYVAALILFAPAYFPAILAFLIVKDCKKRKVCKMVMLWSLAYCGFFSTTTSGRALLLPLPLSFLCVGLFTEAVFESLKKMRDRKKPAAVAYRFFTAFAVTLLPLVFLGKDVAFNCMRLSEYKTRGGVESYLKNHGCKKVQEIFSTDFSIYFRSMPPYYPYFNGGAPRLGAYHFNEEYPEFPVDSLKEFSSECKKRGIRFVVLTEGCRLLSPAMGDLYNGVVGHDDIKFMKKINQFKIFEVQTQSLPVCSTLKQEDNYESTFP